MATTASTPMALWYELSGESQRTPEPLDMLLFLKRNPHMTAKWTQLLDGINHKCMVLQIPVERFYKRPRALRKEKEEPRELSSSNNSSNTNDETGADDSGAPEPSATVEDKPSANTTGSPDAAPAPRMDWNELCFFLAMQLEIAMTTPSAASTSFPAPLSRNLRQLWPKKKIKRVAAVFARHYGDRESGASPCVCAYDGIGELKNGQVKCVFLCDAFLSSLVAMQRERAARSAALAPFNDESAVDTRDGDETATQDAVDTRSVVHSASAMAPSDDRSFDNHPSATDTMLAPPLGEEMKQSQEQADRQLTVARSTGAEVLALGEALTDSSSGVTASTKTRRVSTAEARSPAASTAPKTEVEERPRALAPDKVANVEGSRGPAIERADTSAPAHTALSKSEELGVPGVNLASAAASA